MFGLLAGFNFFPTEIKAKVTHKIFQSFIQLCSHCSKLIWGIFSERYDQTHSKVCFSKVCTQNDFLTSVFVKNKWKIVHMFQKISLYFSFSYSQKCNSQILQILFLLYCLLGFLVAAPNFRLEGGEVGQNSFALNQTYMPQHLPKLCQFFHVNIFTTCSTSSMNFSCAYLLNFEVLSLW